MQNIRAEVRLPTKDVRDDIPFFTKRLGMRLEKIFPADDPEVAVFSGHGLRISVEKGISDPPATIRILADDPVLIAGGATELTAPNGTRVEIAPLDPPVVMPEATQKFVVRRLADQAPWIVGRAGMHYRDLIPDRLGGAIIASHIRIPDGGPVPDMVHYHSVGFQLIFCYKGWVDLVYEDQGPPFRLHAGNCVIQPPEIRHRVLYASDNIEVIEIGVPARHMTTIDHDMILPNDTTNPARLFEGQRFVHHKADEADWGVFRLPGLKSRDTTIAENTGGVAAVHVARKGDGETVWSRHGAEINFTFVIKGTMRLEGAGRMPADLSEGDAFVVPPDVPTRYADLSDDLEILEVSLPGTFATSLDGLQTDAQVAD
ncbi:MAG: cupin domain-containing protein [Pseudomonadota bacterium]